MKWGAENGQSVFLQQYVQTRWYSFVNMCHRVINFKNGFLEMRESSEDGKTLPSSIREIIDPDFFTKIEFLWKVLRPFNETISSLERKDSHIGDVLICFIKMIKYVQEIPRDSLSSQFSNVREYLLGRLLERMRVFERPVYIVGLYLMPQFRYICTSKKYKAINVHKMALQLAKDWIKMNRGTAELFGSQILKYHSNQGDYNNKEADPHKYWEKFKSNILGEFACTLFKLVPGTASVERLFSKLSRTKTIYRNRMLSANLLSHGKIKLEALNSYDNGDKKGITLEENVWEFEELTELVDIEEEELTIIGDENEYDVPFDINLTVFDGDVNADQLSHSDDDDFTGDDIFPESLYI